MTTTGERPEVLGSRNTSCAKEWAALLECASPCRDRARLEALLHSLDWDVLLALADKHGVNGPLATSLHELLDSLVPPGIKAKVIERQRAQIFFCLRLTAELYRVLHAFGSEGIGALAIKGPTLALRAYGDPAMRSYGDLDLLVRQADMRRATELMTAAGYAAAVQLNDIDAGKIPGQYLFFKFFKPASRLLVELHNDRTLRYFPRRLPLEDFFSRQVRLSMDAQEVPALAIEDELVLICIHGAKHFWERLLWIADVAALVERQMDIDWKRVFESAKAVGAEIMVRASLRLAGELLKAQLPERVREQVMGDRAARELAEQSLKWLVPGSQAAPGILGRALFRLRMRGNWMSAPGYLLRLTFSPTEEDWSRGKRETQHPFFDAIRRPFRLARKHGRSSQP